MFSSGYYNPLNVNRTKRFLKMRTSAGEQGRYIQKIIQGSRNPVFSHNNANKQNKINVRRQSKRYTDVESDEKNTIKLKQFYQNNICLYKENQLFKSTISPRNRLGKNQSQFFQYIQPAKHFKADKLLFNKKSFINSQIELNNSQSKYSKMSALSCQNRLQQTQSRNKTDRSQNYGNLSKKIMEKMKNFNNNKIKTLRESQAQNQPQKKTIFYQFNTIKGSKQINQDTVKVGDGIWIVCDGHGEHGHDVSWFVANLLFQLYHQKMRKYKFSKTLLKEIFMQVEQSLQESQIDIVLSGSTCVMVVLIQQKIYCASVGDSVAIAVSESFNFQMISAEHKPCKVQQAKRIQFFGGKVKKTLGKEHLPMSPFRLWGQGIDEWGPGLAVSRSFGDKMAQKYGLIYDPQIKQIQIGKSTKFIVLGSDGLFDQVKPMEIVNILNNQNKLQKHEACKVITQIAQSRWIGYSDDISGVVIYL